MSAASAAGRLAAPSPSAGQSQGQGRRFGKGFYALLIAAAAVRLALAPIPGYFHDLQLYVNWGALFERHLLDFYSAGARLTPQPNYPPLTIYLYGLLDWIAGAWCQVTHVSAASCVLSVGAEPPLDVFMKLPTLLAELALTAVIYAVARRTHSSRAAVAFAAAYAFSPVALLDGPLWGQIDALSTLGLVLALLAAARGRGLWAGALFALAVLIKPQPVVFAPLILVALWRMGSTGRVGRMGRTGGWRRALCGLAGMAVAGVAVCLPYLLPPRFELLRFWQDTTHIMAALPNSTLSGFNLWWLLGAQRVPYSDPYLGPFSATLVGWALFAAVLAYALVRLWQNPTPRQLWLGAGLVAVAFFVLTTLQHERYLYPAVALFLVAAIYDRRAWLLYALASLTAFANMVVILVNPVVSSSGLVLPTWRTYLEQRPVAAVGIAILNLALLAAAGLTLAATLRAPTPAAFATPALGGIAGTEGDRAGIAAHVGKPPGSGDARTGSAAVAERRAGEHMDVAMRDLRGMARTLARASANGLRRLRAWVATPEGKRFCILFALAALVRVVMLPYRGFYDDVQAFVTWGAFFDHHPLLFYSQGAHVSPVPDYPPLAMYLFGLLAALDVGSHRLLGKQIQLHVNYSHALPIVFKLPILLVDLALIAVIYAVARRRLRTQRAALIATATYAFSPVVLFTGVLWGQIDPIFILLVVLALLAAVKGRGAPAGALFALAILIKPQPVVFAPLLLVYLWRWQGRREALRAVAAMAIVGFVVCWPYLLPPHVDLLAFQRDLAAWERAVPYTSVSAFNLWWLLGAQKLPYTTPYLGPLSPNILGWGLFFVVLAVVLVGVWRVRAAGHLFFAAGLIAMAFFMLTPLQHERYLLPAVALLLLAAIYDRRHWLFYALVTTAATLNAVLVVIDPVFSDSKIPHQLAIGRHFLRTHPVVFSGLSALNVALLLAMLVVYVRDLARAARRAEAMPVTPAELALRAGAGASLGGTAGTAGTTQDAPRAPDGIDGIPDPVYQSARADAQGQAQGQAQDAPITTQRTSIVLPAYNEEAVIADTVRACLRAAERLCPNAEIIVVDDGSRDRTGAIADQLAAADARVIACHHPTNRGYGAALISGFAAARGDLLFFMDGDGQFDIEDIAALLRVEREQPGTVVVGYRQRRQDHLMRKVNAWGWKQAVRLVLGLRGIRDIDCAFKLFPTPLVRACAVTSEGAMVNTELLIKLQRMGIAIVQVPVRHLPRTHGSATGAHPRVIVKAFRELLALRRRLRHWQPETRVQAPITPAAITPAAITPAAIAPAPAPVTQPLDETQPGLTPNALT